MSFMTTVSLQLAESKREMVLHSCPEKDRRREDNTPSVQCYQILQEMHQPALVFCRNISVYRKIDLSLTDVKQRRPSILLAAKLNNVQTKRGLSFTTINDKNAIICVWTLSFFGVFWAFQIYRCSLPYHHAPVQ